MATVKYIGPSAAVEIADTGQWVERGETVEVSSELAGRTPSGKPEDEDYDPGEGLLAQTGNWAKPTTKAAKAVATPKESTTDA